MFAMQETEEEDKDVGVEEEEEGERRIDAGRELAGLDRIWTEVEDGTAIPPLSNPPKSAVSLTITTPR